MLFIVILIVERRKPENLIKEKLGSGARVHAHLVRIAFHYGKEITFITAKYTFAFKKENCS